MDHEGSRPSGPVGDVLFHPELLEKILDFCSHSDQKQLLNSRLVCSFWRDCAFSVFANNLSICPAIDLNSEYLDTPPLSRFLEMVKPSSKLAVIAIMKYYEPCPPKILEDYAHNIVSIEAYDLIFDHELQHTQFPQLRRLRLDNAIERKIPFERLMNYFRTGGHRLVELILCSLQYDIQIGVLSNLKVLKFGCNVSIIGAESLSKLLPKLSRVKIDTTSNTNAVVSMTENGAVFTNVVTLEIDELWQISTEETESITMKIAKCFPNLRNFEWKISAPLALRTPGIQILFSKLENLTSLKLEFRNGTPSDLFRLLTNLSVVEIPDDIEEWSDALVETRKTLCNLKKLRSLRLEQNRGLTHSC